MPPNTEERPHMCVIYGAYSKMQVGYTVSPEKFEATLHISMVNFSCCVVPTMNLPFCITPFWTPNCFCAWHNTRAKTMWSPEKSTQV